MIVGSLKSIPLDIHLLMSLCRAGGRAEEEGQPIRGGLASSRGSRRGEEKSNGGENSERIFCLLRHFVGADQR